MPKSCKYFFLRPLLSSLLCFSGLAAAGETVHVADENSSQNFFFDTSTNFWSLGNSYTSGYIPVYIAITPNGVFSYTTSVGSKAVVVNNIAAGFPFQVAAIPILGGGSPISIDISPDGSLAYVAVRHLSIANLNHIAVIDTATNTIITTVDTGVGLLDSPSAVKFTPNGQQVWVGHTREGVIEVIDVATNTVLTGPSYPILSGAGPAEIAFTPDGNTAYVTNSGYDDVTGIDVDTVTVINAAGPTPGGIKVLSVGNRPTGIAMTPDGNYAYVTNFGPGNGAHTVSVIATGGSTCAEPLEAPPCVLTTVPVGVNPYDVAITADGAFAYVSNRNSRNVSVISTATNTVIATVSINSGGNIFTGIAIAPPPDSDSDGVEDSIDNCKNIPNPGQEDNEPDGIGDVCDPDDDNDGQSDDHEIACGSLPKDANSTSLDTDSDNVPDCVDLDDDNDGQTDADELACGSLPQDDTSLSPDNDSDQSPDCVDPDDDNDGVNDDVPDNCPFDKNPMQSDSDGDDIGDVCDPDLAGNALITATVGGEVETGNSGVSLIFDPGDLSSDTEVSVVGVETPLNVELGLSVQGTPLEDSSLSGPLEDGGTPPKFDLGQVLAAYNFEPNGLNFNSGVSLTMVLDVTELHDSQRAAVDIYARLGNGRYSPQGADCPLTNDPPGTITVTCTVEISHFSIYALIAPRDSDGDGVFDRFAGIEDNCPGDFNPDQSDIYGNGLGDACDPEYIFHHGFEGGVDN